MNEEWKLLSEDEQQIFVELFTDILQAVTNRKGAVVVTIDKHGDGKGLTVALGDMFLIQPLLASARCVGSECFGAPAVLQ